MEITSTSLCGQLLVAGFHGAVPSPALMTALERGACGGFVVFKRNLLPLAPASADGAPADGRPRIEALAASLQTIVERAPRDLPPLLAIDQEGGRVARLGAPVLTLPPMRTLADAAGATAADTPHEATLDLVRRAGAALGRELQAIGFTMDFAPIFDVDSNPANPIIGDRAFARTPEAAGRLALAFARGLTEGGVLACGKHFPGHGDTSTDSHLELPTVHKTRAELERTELGPFRLAARAGSDVPALMTAHVLYPGLDPSAPATLSPRIATELLRGELGYEGVLVSDDLEMKALSEPVEHTAVAAIRAGCDLLLVCSDEALFFRAHEALVRAAEADPSFRARCEEAHARGLAMRRSRPPRIASPEARTAIFAEHAPLREELARLLQGTSR